MQRTLASKSLAEGQKGIVFAAFLKLLVPFLVVIPGILAYNLYSGDLRGEAIKKNMENSNLSAFVNYEEYNNQLASEGIDVKKIVRQDGFEKRTENFRKIDNTVVPLSTQFVALHPEIAEKVIRHNLELAYGEKAPDQTKNAKKYAEGQEVVNNEFQHLHADFANPETNRSQRIGLAELIVNWNNDVLKEMNKADEQGLTMNGVAFKLAQGNKLVGYDFDAAFPTLLKNLLRPGFSWFVLAALFGAVVSSLASMLNSASTIFTMDIYFKCRKKAQPKALVRVGKIGVLVCVLIAFFVALQLDNPRFNGIFNFVQQFQGFISPGALCVFLFGFFVPKCPRYFGWLGIVLNVFLYGFLLTYFSEIAFLNRMAICFGIITTVGFIATWIHMARGGKTIALPVNKKVNVESSNRAKLYGWVVVFATLALYYIFW